MEKTIWEIDERGSSTPNLGVRRRSVPSASGNATGAGRAANGARNAANGARSAPNGARSALSALSAREEG